MRHPVSVVLGLKYRGQIYFGRFPRAVALRPLCFRLVLTSSLALNSRLLFSYTLRLSPLCNWNAGKVRDLCFYSLVFCSLGGAGGREQWGRGRSLVQTLVSLIYTRSACAYLLHSALLWWLFRGFLCTLRRWYISGKQRALVREGKGAELFVQHRYWFLSANPFP